MTKRKQTKKYQNRRSSQIKKEVAKRKADLHTSNLNSRHSNQICKDAKKGKFKIIIKHISTFLLSCLRLLLTFGKKHKGIASLLLSIAFGIAIAAFFYYLPAITLTPGESIDEYNPFATSFILKNEGEQALENIQCSIAFDDPFNITFEDKRKISVSDLQFIFKNHPDYTVKNLDPHSSSNIFIENIYAAPKPDKSKKEQIFYVIVSYEPAICIYRIIRKHYTKKFRFLLRLKENNGYVIYEKYK